MADYYRPMHGTADAVFCCVGSITARQAVWRTLGGRCLFRADGRMLGEVIRVLVAADERGQAHYGLSPVWWALWLGLYGQLELCG